MGYLRKTDHLWLTYLMYLSQPYTELINETKTNFCEIDFASDICRRQFIKKINAKAVKDIEIHKKYGPLNV